MNSKDCLARLKLTANGSRDKDDNRLSPAWMGSKEEDQSPEEEKRPQPEKEGPSIERPEEQ